MAKKLSFLLYGLLLLCYLGYTTEAESKERSNPMKILEREAVRLAEKFVKNQGYTSYPPSVAPKKEIVFESLEFDNDVDATLERRRGSLTPKAIGAIVNENQWLVAFSYANSSPDSNRGRAVKMGLDGQNIRVMHEDLDLSAFNNVNLNRTPSGGEG